MVWCQPSDSLELSVHVAGQVKIDIFFLYPEAGNQTWVGGMIVGKREKLKSTPPLPLPCHGGKGCGSGTCRWVYPGLERVCAGVLLGSLMWVPCDVAGFLEADYGPHWDRPAHDSTFVWYKDHSNIQVAPLPWFLPRFNPTTTLGHRKTGSGAAGSGRASTAHTSGRATPAEHHIPSRIPSFPCSCQNHVL